MNRENKIQIPFFYSKFLIIILSVCAASTIVISIFIYFQGRGKYGGQTAYEVIPEYNRTMEKVIISIPIKNTLVPSLSLTSHFEHLKYLPDYTDILIILPENRIDEAKTALIKSQIINRVILYPFKTIVLEKGHLYLIFAENDKLMDSGLIKNLVIPKGTIWAQDLFKPAKNPDSGIVLLVPDAYKMFYSSKGNTLKESVGVQPDNLFLSSLFLENSPDKINVLRIPLVFMGGNILVDQYKGQTIAFCGSDILADARIVWQACYGEYLEEKKFIAMVKKYLNVNTVLILGKGKLQPPYMFHLDQAMILLPGRVVGVTTLAGDAPPSQHSKDIEKIRSFLGEVRSVFRQLGYTIINIETSQDNIINHEFFVNSIPYINKKTGKRKMLMPVPYRPMNSLEEKMVRNNILAFESVGYDVITVPSQSTSLRGGIHCLINVIN